MDPVTARRKIRLGRLAFFFHLILLLSSCASSSPPIPFFERVRLEGVGFLKEEYRQRLADEKNAQNLRDQIVAELATSGRPNEKPLLIFTAGAMGAGKSFLLDELAAGGYYDPEQFARVDPDLIKLKIPEYRIFLAMDPQEAATFVHQESGRIADELLEKTLQSGKNVIVDGSLRNSDWYQGQFQRIRKEYPQYSIVILYVKASEPTILARIAKRARDPKDGRYTPEDLALRSMAEVEKSIRILHDLADLTLTINNDQKPILESIYREGKAMTLQMEIPLSENSPGYTSSKPLIQAFLSDPKSALERTQAFFQGERGSK